MVDVEKLLKKRNVLMNTIKYAVEQNEEKLSRKTETDIIEIASSVQIIKSKLKSIVEFNEAVMDELSEVQATVEGEKNYLFELQSLTKILRQRQILPESSISHVYGNG